jgi:hypothetical protein
MSKGKGDEVWKETAAKNVSSKKPSAGERKSAYQAYRKGGVGMKRHQTRRHGGEPPTAA